MLWREISKRNRLKLWENHYAFVRRGGGKKKVLRHKSDWSKWTREGKSMRRCRGSKKIWGGYLNETKDTMVSKLSC